jgi:L-amino acid N-acyltransferase YncA
VILVRRFATTDYDAVLTLDVAEQGAYRGILWDSATEREREAFLMTSPRNRTAYAESDYCFVAVDAAAIVGFLFALRLLPDVLVVDAVGVAQAMRRKGVGRQIYAVLLEQARKRGIHRIQALISLDNPASIGLHQSAGFTLRDRKDAVLEL